MKRIGWLLLCGFLTWFVALAISMAVYPLKKSGDPLFETVMTLTVAPLAVLATLVYFRRVRRLYLLEGLALGTALFLVNIVLDLPLFMFGPMAMPLRSYVGDIGLTYLVYPIVTVGSGVLLSAAVARARAEARTATEAATMTSPGTPPVTEPAAAEPLPQVAGPAEPPAPPAEEAAEELPVA